MTMVQSLSTNINWVPLNIGYKSVVENYIYIYTSTVKYNLEKINIALRLRYYEIHMVQYLQYYI